MQNEHALGMLEGVERFVRDGGVLVHENERGVIKYINRYGAVTMLDVLSRKEIEEITYNYLKSFI